MSKTVVRAALLLCIIGAGGAMPSGVVAPSLTTMAPALGEGQEGMFLAQMVMTISALAMAVSATFVGWLSEHIGYSLTIVGGLAGFAIFGSIGAFTESPWILVASRLVLGVSAAAMITPACALIFYYFEGKLRERVFGLMTAGSAVFAIGSSAASGFIVRDFGWHAVYLIYAVMLIPLVAVPFLLTNVDGTRSPIKPPPVVKGERLPLGSVAGVLLFAMLMAMLMFNVVVQIPFMLAERGYDDPRFVSLAVGVECGLQIVGAILFGTLNTRLSMRYMMAMVFILFGIGHLVVGLFAPIVVIFIGIAVIGFASAFTKPATASYLLRKLPPSMHGRASGAVITALYMGGFLNPVLISPIAAGMGSFQSFVLIGVVNMIAFALAIMPLRVYRSAPQAQP